MIRLILAAAAVTLSLATPAALAADAKQMEDNKKAVAAFYDANRTRGQVFRLRADVKARPQQTA